ncbi:MAG: hypothetical protein IJR61_06620 [Clostridia bacterium]|nr:hypothetical protein [Clostridia bacterium]
MRKKILLFCLAIVFVMISIACKKLPKTPEFIEKPELADKNLSFIESDWLVQSGTWNFDGNVLTQSSYGVTGRILHNCVDDQNYLNLSVDIKLSNEATEGGLEFRAGYQYNAKERLTFVLDKKNDSAGIYVQSGSRAAADKKDLPVKADRWYRLRVELSGVSANYYIDDELWITRNDVSLKEDCGYICLLSESGGISFRNFEYTTDLDRSYTWEELVSASDVSKSGWDRFNANKFEYPYVGLGRTTLLVGPYGFLTPEANRPGLQSYQYKNDPALIYDYWWDDAIKVTPFTFSGGYMVKGRVRNGKVTEDVRTAYSQRIDISSGLLSTVLTLDVEGEYVNSVREMIVNTDGVVAYRITNDTKSDFAFEANTEAGFHAEYSAMENGFVIRSNLRKDTENQAYLAVKGVSDKGVNVDLENGRITFKATDKPVYIYLSPSSTLNEGDGAKVGAIERLNRANFDTALKQGEEIYNDVYSRSQISIPDKGMGVWYVRSLFYHVVSMYGTRVPVGCYGSNPDGFFGNVCFEYDLMFQQFAMLYLNQTELSGSSVDWVINVKENVNRLAREGYTDKYGTTLPVLIENGYMYTWLMGWDGSPAHGDEVDHEANWPVFFPGANVALSVLKQAEYTDGDLTEAKDIMAGQLRVLLSLFEYSEEDDWWWSINMNTGEGMKFSVGYGNRNAAAVCSIRAMQKIYERAPELFTEEDVAELEVWVKMLDKMWPASYYNTRFHTGVGGEYLPTTIGAGGDVDTFVCVFPMMLAWYNCYPYDMDEVTLTAIGYKGEDGGNFKYFFNAPWAAFLAARTGQAELAENYAKHVLKPICLYDDAYFCENLYDESDYKRSPETGAHGAYLMAISAMMFDGENEDRITIFPAISEQWQKTGVSFGRYLATGNIEVSAEFTNEKTAVTLKNNSAVTVTREMRVRVSYGCGAAIYNGEEYPIKDGCFAIIPVTLAAGETLEMEVTGIEKDVEIANFHVIFPVDGSDKIRPENVIFHWSRSDTATEYKLVISKNGDLSDPVFVIDMGQKTLYYPTVERDHIDLEEGVTYYWAVYGVKGGKEVIADDGICSFTVKKAEK